MKLPYWHADAFTDRTFGGNQAAVMPLETWLPDATLLAIAAENLFAETAFLVRDASGHVLLTRDGGERIAFRTRQSGVLEVRRVGSAYEVALPAIPTTQGDWPEAVALLGSQPTEVWRNPLGYDLFLYEDERTIRSLRPDLRGLEALGNNLFICTAPGARTDIVSRVFVPGGGVDEDPVTGAAHATLTPFWAQRLSRSAFTAHQASARGGDLACRLDGERVWLSGGCVTVVEGTFYLAG
jgi:predicted PhzF superfamily epimerase YddE/YHI9